MKMARFLFATLAALSTLAQAAPEGKDPVHPFDDYGPAMASTETAPLLAVWQVKNADAIKEATSDAVLAEAVATPESASALLAKLRPAYDNDPIVLIQVAAVTQWVMGKDPCWLCFWAPKPSSGRKVWVKALVSAAETAKDPYVAQLCLDQLRWCGCACPELCARIRAIGAKSDDKGVKDLAAIAERTLSEAK